MEQLIALLPTQRRDSSDIKLIRIRFNLRVFWVAEDCWTIV